MTNVFRRYFVGLVIHIESKNTHRVQGQPPTNSASFSFLRCATNSREIKG